MTITTPVHDTLEAALSAAVEELRGDGKTPDAAELLKLLSDAESPELA